MALDVQVDDLSNKHSTNSSLPADNSLFPIWCELLTVFSNSNEMGAAIHLKGKERSEFKALYISTCKAQKCRTRLHVSALDYYCTPIPLDHVLKPLGQVLVKV